MLNLRILNRTCRIFVFVGLFLIVAGFFSFAPVQASYDKSPVEQEEYQPTSYIYSVKILCVPMFGEAEPALVPGVYMTAVNVHNPWRQPVEIIKWVTLSPPQGEAPMIGERISDKLEPYQAFDIDCEHMVREFGLEGKQVPGGKGFLIIRSSRELDVVGVYTAEQLAGGRGVGMSLDVEYITPRVDRVELPDLTVRITDWRGEGCPGGQGTCSLSVEYVITNTGTVNITDDFNVLIEGAPLPSKTVTVTGGLAAGASMPFTQTLGPGNSCFNPDCGLRVTVDSADNITESNEGNNVDTLTILG